MPTLSDILRNYIPSTESALAEPITQHFANLPSKTEENLANQMNALQAAFPDNTLKNANTKAMAEMAMQAPISGTAKYIAEKLSPAYEKIAKSYFPGAVKDSLDDVLRSELTTWINGASDIPTKKGFQEYLKYNYANDTLGQEGYPLKEGLKRLNELVNSKSIVFKPSRKEIIEEQIKKVK